MSKKKPPSDSILFISYHYPPDSQIGAKRISRLAEYFAKSGWEVGLLTVKDKYYEKIDRSLEIRGIKEYRTRMFESTRFFLRGIKKVATGGRPKKNEPATYENETVWNLETSDGDVPAVLKPGIISRLKNIVFSVIWFPDDRRGWIPFGLPSLLKLAKHYRSSIQAGLLIRLIS